MAELKIINKSHVGGKLFKTNPILVHVTLAELCGLEVLDLCLY